MENESRIARRQKPRRKKLTPGLRILRTVGRSLTVVLCTLLFAVALVYAACLVLTHGPSERAGELLVLSLDETSALKFLPYWLLPAGEVQEILHPSAREETTEAWQELGYEPAAGQSGAGEEQPLVQISEESVSDELELIDIRERTFKGKLLIIHDPSRVIVGTLDSYGGNGMYLTEFVEKYNAVAGTNAGGFYDPDGMGTGGIPAGLVMKDGKIDYGSAHESYNGVIGFDANYVLHVGQMTGQEALDLGLQTAVSFKPGPTLIKDGVKATNLGGGVNPRTCIGQRADGAVLLAVIEGRHPDSLGATYDDLADLMESYGAVNAGNLDGGSSSAMIYEGKQVTKGSTIIGSREMCNAILVLPAGGER